MFLTIETRYMFSISLITDKSLNLGRTSEKICYGEQSTQRSQVVGAVVLCIVPGTFVLVIRVLGLATRISVFTP